MIRLACGIPHKVIVACSGGPDSMAALDFCIRGKRDVIVAHFNHGTEYSGEYEKLVRRFCEKKRVPCVVRWYSDVAFNSRESQEERWRNARIRFFLGFSGETVVTGHNLDDAAEWWLMSSIHGKGKLIARNRVYTEDKHPFDIDTPDVEVTIIRPFLLTRKSVLESWCCKNKVPYLIDPTNSDGSNARSNVRHKMIKNVTDFHPGFFTTVMNLYKC